MAAASAARMVAAEELWLALADHVASELPELVGRGEHMLLRRLIATLGEWWPRIETLSRTLVHNDFNPRNIALRDRGDGLELCAYDLELATLHIPQRDLAELLCFTLDEHATEAQVSHHLETHRAALEHHSGVVLDRREWREGDGRFRAYDFLDSGIAALWRLLELEGDRPRALAPVAEERVA
jgi:aminoglycoside phosphotransferase (APT) family kinase protein